MSAFNMGGLRPDQGPPLWVPLSFFLLASVTLAAAGLVVLGSAGAGLDSVWAGLNAAVVHLVTLGFLLLVMLGALYQMLPVVAGAVVPWPRLAHLAQALVVTGGGLLVWGMGAYRPGAFLAAAWLLGAGLLVFFAPAAFALWRSEVRLPAVAGIRVAFLGLLAVAAVGLHLAFARGMGGYPPDWAAWRFAHAHLGFIGWVGALISAVSWQVVPMFYLTAEAPRRATRAVTAGIGVSIVALLGVYALRLPLFVVPFATLPGAAAVWLLQPAMVAWALRKRRRRRPDMSLRFWWLAMASAPLCFALGAATTFVNAPSLSLAYGLLVLWGWAAAVIHGMLTRIVPFLVWFHRCAPWVGKVPVPSTRELYPERGVALGFWLHLCTLGVGLAAVAVGNPWLWRGLGLGVMLTALHLGARMVLALAGAPKPPAAPPVGG